MQILEAIGLILGASFVVSFVVNVLFFRNK